MSNLEKDYVEVFCYVDGYRCHMPIEYELVRETVTRKIYRKIGCNCHNVRAGKCNEGRTTCKHFLVASETLEL